MQSQTFRKQIPLLIALFALLASGATWVFGQENRSNDAAVTRTLDTFTVEIVEFGGNFTPDEAPVHEDGFPAYGSAFVTQGYLYEEGTLAMAEFGGVLEDGSPEFPDRVIGEWSCWGYHVGDGGHTETGPIVVTTQLYNFGDMPGIETITTIGYELADTEITQTRAVTGGTGKYRAARGTQTQVSYGFNHTFGVNMSATFEVDTIQDMFFPVLRKDG